ncbi:phosphoribosylformylglycinamidine cyclo-ligase, partial [Paracoccaceae bacterium]|nr:phosphoribosylformylglycinamidine cyclo-ligase [Paracoccaceae bacterium]
STFDNNVVNGIGDFAALYSIENENVIRPALASACDGVGTKIKLALELEHFSGLGKDLVAMNINDLLCVGAKPLFFLDYLSMSKLNITRHSQIISSIAEACKEAKISLVGGETAEMPGIYSKKDFDLAGFAVGILDLRQKFPRKIAMGDLVFGLPSSGPHSNGFTLIRKLLEKYSTVEYFEFKKSFLAPTRLYTNFARDPKILSMASGFAHITGGGIIENIPRILPRGTTAEINLSSWDIPTTLRWAIKEANLNKKQALKTFNCGIGFIIVIPQKHEKDFKSYCSEIREPIFKIGRIIKGKNLTFNGKLNLE